MAPASCNAMLGFAIQVIKISAMTRSCSKHFKNIFCLDRNLKRKVSRLIATTNVTFLQFSSILCGSCGLGNHADSVHHDYHDDSDHSNDLEIRLAGGDLDGHHTCNTGQTSFV